MESLFRLAEDAVVVVVLVIAFLPLEAFHVQQSEKTQKTEPRHAGGIKRALVSEGSACAFLTASLKHYLLTPFSLFSTSLSTFPGTSPRRRPLTAASADDSSNHT